MRRAANKHDVELAKLRNEKALMLIGVAVRFVDKLPWLTFCVCGYLAVTAIAGKTTSFGGIANAAVDVSVNQWAAWIVAALCGIGYVRERHVRKKTIAGNAKHIEALETQIDPNRHSSGLLLNGQGRPEDRHVP